MKNDKIEQYDIAILTGKSISKSKFQPGKQFGIYQISQDVTYQDDAIVFQSVRKFKGLERKVIILIEMDDLLEEPEKNSDIIYVALTRAIGKLFILGMGEF